MSHIRGKMNVLISNDDGIYSKSLLALVKEISKKHNVLVIAPDGNRSMTAHSVNFNKKIKIKRVNLIDNVVAYKTSGSPCDSIKIAKHAFTDFDIDLVVSGINLGHNLSSDILYSGTVSICYESAYFGIPSFAFSAFSHDDDYDFTNFAKISVELIDKLYKKMSSNTIINVNFPDKNTQINGIKITKLGKFVYDDECKRLNRNSILIRGEETKKKGDDPDTDYEWIKKGYVTITPLIYDKTDYAKFNDIEKEISIYE